MNVPKGISSNLDGEEIKESENILERKIVKVGHEIKAIRVSVIVSPVKENAVRDRNFANERPSCSLGVQSDKSSDSVRVTQKDSDTNTFLEQDNENGIYASLLQEFSFSSRTNEIQDGHTVPQNSVCDDNTSKDCTTNQPSVSTSMLSDQLMITQDSNVDKQLITLDSTDDEQIITLDSTDDENASYECTTIRSSSSSFSATILEDEQKVTAHSFVDANAYRESIDNERSATYTGVNENLEQSTIDIEEIFPYECAHCDAGFSDADALCEHSTIHGRHFICKRCTRSFKTRRQFFPHILRHTIKGKILNCPICNHGFASKHGLSQHKLRKH